MFQFLTDRKNVVINGTKLGLISSKNSPMQYYYHTPKQSPFYVLSNRIKINSKNDLINNCYSI